VPIREIRGKKNKKMTRKNILIAIVTFIVGFGSTFYIIRTYFPKQKVEKTAQIKDSLTKTEANFRNK
jgi:hypothetical protein